MSRFSSGPEGGYGVSSPQLEIIPLDYTFTSVTMNTGAPQLIKRINGQHRIYLTYVSGGQPYTWYFSLTGGTNQILPTSYYSPSNNYITVPADPPRGCAVTKIAPAPNTTRTDVFQVVENLTGLNISLVFAYCPTMGIESTVTYSGGVLASNLSLNLVLYRNFNRAITGALAFSYQGPDYGIVSWPTSMISSGGVNPLDNHIPLPFSRVSGQQEIVVTNTTTNFFFSFVIDYAIVKQGNGYIGYCYSPTLNAIVQDEEVGISNLTYQALDNIYSETNPVRLTITTVAPDSKTYIFVFYPFTSEPTITLQAPATLGAQSLSVIVNKNSYLAV